MDSITEIEEASAAERCPACFTTSVERARISPDILLMEGPDGWFLLQLPGERDDVLAHLGKSRPYPDPWPEFGDGDEDEEDAYIDTEEAAAKFAAQSVWLDQAQEAFAWEPASHPMTYWYLVNDLIKAGYDPETTTGLTDLALWVYDKAGRALEATQ